MAPKNASKKHAKTEESSLVSDPERPVKKASAKKEVDDGKLTIPITDSLSIYESGDKELVDTIDEDEEDGPESIPSELLEDLEQIYLDEDINDEYDYPESDDDY